MQIGAEGTGLNCDAHLWWQNKVFRIKWRRAVAGGGGGSWRRRRRRRRMLLPAVPKNVELWQTMRKRRRKSTTPALIRTFFSRPGRLHAAASIAAQKRQDPAMIIGRGDYRATGSQPSPRRPGVCGFTHWIRPPPPLPRARLSVPSRTRVVGRPGAGRCALYKLRRGVEILKSARSCCELHAGRRHAPPAAFPRGRGSGSRRVALPSGDVSLGARQRQPPRRPPSCHSPMRKEASSAAKRGAVSSKRTWRTHARGSGDALRIVLPRETCYCTTFERPAPKAPGEFENPALKAPVKSGEIRCRRRRENWKSGAEGAREF
eukprot:gene16394-biopygen21788